MDLNLFEVFSVIIIIEVQMASPWPAGASSRVLPGPTALQVFDSFLVQVGEDILDSSVQGLAQIFNQTFLQGLLVSFSEKWPGRVLNVPGLVLISRAL